MFGKVRIPAEVSAHLRGFGALATSPLADGDWLAVGRGEGAVVNAGGVVRRWPWTDVESARWDGDLRELHIVWADGVSDLVLRTASDDVLAATAAIRDRLNASIVHVEFLTTAAGGEVRALIRRSGDGGLFSQVVARGPVSEADMPAIDGLERRAREAAGMPTD